MGDDTLALDVDDPVLGNTVSSVDGCRPGGMVPPESMEGPQSGVVGQLRSHPHRADHNRAMISCVVPVSPNLGKIRVMLLKCASELMSVMASVTSVTLKPSSCAWRAVDSTPLLVATPASTTCVTESPLRCCSRFVPVNAPHVCLRTR